jgi:Flp pilus assembly protein TadG
MAEKNESQRQSRFLRRLLRDQSGNVIAIMAASIFPMLGLIGGAVDMSRIYLVRSKLQAACDAGSLMGRKQMGLGAWNNNNGLANTKALQMFDLNFEDGSYGSSNLQRSYTGSLGRVDGVASADLPMALMQVLGVEETTITVDCTAELKIPNTDVMFILDTTGSMAWGADGNGASASNPSRISGLRTAVKCFYEALAKKNIDNADLPASACGETADPSTVNGATAEIRFAFVPYAVNVNVGKLLPHSFMANEWKYQSRVPEMITSTTTGNTPTYGPESAQTLTDTSNIPGTVVGPTILSPTSTVGGVEYAAVGGTPYQILYASTQNGTCTQTAPAQQNGQASVGPMTLISTTPSPVAPPTTQVTRTYQQDTLQGGQTTYGYYKATSGSGKKIKYYCALAKVETSSNTVRRTYRSTQSVTWTTATQTLFNGWRYKKDVEFDVSALKKSTGGWNDSLLLPLGKDGALKQINWKGCIEERKTYRLTTSTPANEWDPIPADALDMNIDLPPSTTLDGSFWGPSLPEVLYERYVLNSDGDDQTSTRTLNDVVVSLAEAENSQTYKTVNANCPSESRLYKQWDPGDFKTYVNDLQVGGNTYHDIGLLWGARLASPTGLFKNITAPGGVGRERHVIFMTDGDTTANTGVGSNSNVDYNAHGLQWYDRRQTNTSIAPSDTLAEANIDARTQALCKEIKAMPNTTLWVVGYGTTMSAKTLQNLQSCASSGKYIQATSVSTLISEFKQVADAISYLRLTD